jgi:phage terminase small subunit
MARPRTPTAVLEARGSFIAHPERRKGRKNEPKTVGALGDPPKWFDRQQKKIWRELSELIPAGVAGAADRPLMETMVLLKDKEQKGIITDSGRSQLITCYGRFGMTPADRSRVAGSLAEIAHPAGCQPKPKAQKDPWAEFGPPVQA